jgi:ureidoglycolate dehydrogenase (NAD+)
VPALSERVIVQSQALRRFISALFVKSGFSASDAAMTAEVLVWAELRGHESHGVLRIPTYLAWAKKGVIASMAKPEIVLRKGAVVRINAHRAIGPAALTKASDIAVETAREHAAAWVLVQDHSHAGAIGYYARRIADAGMLGLVMTASRPLMAYHGTKGAALSTNPIAIATPGGLVLDMSTSAISKGKISAALARGTQLPAGAAVDADGRPTTDPAKAETLLPLGGAKGSGLSLMIECMTSVALANPLISTALSDTKEAKDFRQNGLVIAMDLGVLGGEGKFESNAGTLAETIKSEPRASGFDEILMPGERGDREMARREAQGIPIVAKTWNELVPLVATFDVALPETRAG